MARALANGSLRKRQPGRTAVLEPQTRPTSRLVTAGLGVIVGAIMFWSWATSIEHLSRDEARGFFLLGSVAMLVAIHAMASYYGIIDALKNNGETHSGAWDADGDGD